MKTMLFILTPKNTYKILLVFIFLIKFLEIEGELVSH